MKKLYIAILVILSSFNSYSQDNPKFMFSGSLGAMYSSYSSNLESEYPNSDLAVRYISLADHTNFNFNINPQFGYFISPRYVLGIGVEYVRESEKYDTKLVNKTLTTGFLLSPFMRYYTSNKLFVQFEFHIGSSKEEIDGNSVNIPGNTGFSTINLTSDFNTVPHGFGAGIGYSIPLSQTISLEPAIKYLWNRQSAKLNFPGEQKKFDININMVLFTVGLNYLTK